MEKNKVSTNVFYNMIYHVLIVIVPFVTTPYVSRILHPDGVGTFAVVQTISKYFCLVALLGMQNYGSRMIAKARDERTKLSKVFSELFGFQLVVSSVVFVFYLLLIFCDGYERYGLTMICQIPYVMSVLFEISWFFSGTEQFKFMVKKNTIIKVVSALLVFLLVKKAEHIWIYALINALSMLLGQLIMWPVLLKQVDFVKVEKSEILQHLKPNLMLFVSVASVSMYTLMDKMMLGTFSSAAQTGFYENSDKLMGICNGIIGAAGTVMLPRVSYLIENQQLGKANEYLNRSLKLFTILSCAIAFGLAGIAEVFSVVYFGEEYVECSQVIRMISFAVIFYSWEVTLRTQYLLPMSKDSIYVKSTILAALVNFCLNCILIPNFGAAGAACATTAAHMTTACYQSISIRKDVPVFQYAKRSLPSVLMGSIMMVLVQQVGAMNSVSVMTIILQIVCGGLFYVLIVGVWLLATKDDLAMKFLRR